jgi:hypothetical protein
MSRTLVATTEVKVRDLGEKVGRREVNVGVYGVVWERLGGGLGPGVGFAEGGEVCIDRLVVRDEQGAGTSPRGGE